MNSCDRNRKKGSRSVLTPLIQKIKLYRSRETTPLLRDISVSHSSVIEIQLKQIWDDHGMRQIVDKPTRGNYLLDLFWLILILVKSTLCHQSQIIMAYWSDCDIPCLSQSASYGKFGIIREQHGIIWDVNGAPCHGNVCRKVQSTTHEAIMDILKRARPKFQTLMRSRPYYNDVDMVLQIKSRHISWALLNRI